MDADQQKRLSRGFSTDMSPEAISRRLDIVVELADLARVLGEAKYVGTARDVEAPSAEDETAASRTQRL